MNKPNYNLAFTLAELLIALAILGVIATFTIPKILDSGSGAKHNAIVKEAASMVSAAYNQHKLNGNATANTDFDDLTQYMNYVRLDTATQIDWTNNAADTDCGTGGGWECILLHNGAIVYYSRNGFFGGTATTTAFYFLVDPDGKYGGSTTGPSKSTMLFLYYNGRIKNVGNIDPNTYWQAGQYNPTPNLDPEYFSWSN